MVAANWQAGHNRLLLYAMFSGDAFVRQFLHHTKGVVFNESNHSSHYRRDPFRRLCHHYRVAAQKHGIQAQARALKRSMFPQQPVSAHRPMAGD
jgi:hypothetical protein